MSFFHTFEYKEKQSMNKYKSPHLIDFKKLGRPEIGYISVAEMEHEVPFDIKRIFWTYHTPDSITRGFHAHHETEMILIAAAGSVVLHTETKEEGKQEWVLENQHTGVYMPPLCWHTMKYSHSAVQLVIASTVYKESDYIRSYDDFLALIK